MNPVVIVQMDADLCHPPRSRSSSLPSTPQTSCWGPPKPRADQSGKVARAPSSQEPATATSRRCSGYLAAMPRQASALSGARRCCRRTFQSKTSADNVREAVTLALVWRWRQHRSFPYRPLKERRHVRL